MVAGEAMLDEGGRKEEPPSEAEAVVEEDAVEEAAGAEAVDEAAAEDDEKAWLNLRAGGCDGRMEPDETKEPSETSVRADAGSSDSGGGGGSESGWLHNVDEGAGI
jgi:hypothetical protein